MIDIYRSAYKSELNVFKDRERVSADEVRIVKRQLFDGEYIHAEPAKAGHYAFGGSFLYTSNGIHPQFNRPIPLHDRDMSLER